MLAVTKRSPRTESSLLFSHVSVSNPLYQLRILLTVLVLARLNVLRGRDLPITSL